MKKLLIVLVLLALVLAGCSGEDQNQVRSFDGVKISYDVQGEGEPVLVFVHGWSCSKEYWKEQVAHFAKKHKVVTIDLAGHGQSGLSRKEYTLEAFGKDVAAVAEKLNLNRIILVGHSIGGFVVVEAARQMPGRVVCVVGADEFHDIEKGFTEEDIKGLIAMIEPDFVKGTQSFVRGMFPPDADPELVDWVVSDMSSADSEIGINVFRNLGNYDLKNAIQEIEVPVYSISSDLWPMNVDGNKKYVKSFKLKMMKGIGHFVMLEDPEKFNKLLEEVIKELE
ncbi:MAG: alpha/beta fold hydrolase [Planctomycetota bacterium]|jgi:pimeloyl-ACP methyl ester carboxylesterase